MRNTICHRVGIKTSLQNAYVAVYHPQKLSGWWAAKARGGTKLGSNLTLDFPGYKSHVWEITELSANEHVHLRMMSGPDVWAKSELDFLFEEKNDQVFITFTHITASDIPDEAFQYFNTKWPLFLVSLKDYLEAGQGQPYPNDIKIQHD